jgi:hypothetical protein
MVLLKVQINMSTSYYPQTYGQTERLNQSLEQYFRCMVYLQPKKWVNWVYLAEWWCNTNYHTALRMTPFKALYGYELPNLPMGSIPARWKQSVN